MCETICIALQKQRDEEEFGTLHVWFNVDCFHWGKDAVYEKSEGEKEHETGNITTWTVLRTLWTTRD